MRLYKEDVMAAVEHKVIKYVTHERFSNPVNIQKGYINALADYAHHVYNLKYGVFVDYDSEQKHLDRMRKNLVYTGANVRYNRGYKAGCLALKSILSRLKAEKEVQT